MDRIMTGGGWALTLVCSQKAVAMADSKKRGKKWFIPSSRGKKIAYAPLGQSVERKRKSGQVLSVQWQGGGGDGWCAWERGFYRVCTDSAKRHVTAVARACLELMSPPPSTQRSVSHFSEHHHVSWGEGRLLRFCQGSSLVLHKVKVRMKCPPTCDIRQKGWTQILWTKWKSSDELNGCIADVRTKSPLRLEDNYKDGPGGEKKEA